MTDYGDLTVTVGMATAEFGPPETEYRFLPDRKFAFDFAWPTLKLALEREGGKFTRVTCQCGRSRTVFVSRHHSRDGLETDIEKYNLAIIAGWVVVRATPGMIASGQAAIHLLDALRSRSVARSPVPATSGIARPDDAT